MAAAGAGPSYRYPFMHSMSIDPDEQSLRAMMGYGRNVLWLGDLFRSSRKCPPIQLQNVQVHEYSKLYMRLFGCAVLKFPIDYKFD
jgi:hypothetical protein